MSTSSICNQCAVRILLPEIYKQTDMFRGHYLACKHIRPTLSLSLVGPTSTSNVTTSYSYIKKEKPWLKIIFQLKSTSPIFVFSFLMNFEAQFIRILLVSSSVHSCWVWDDILRNWRASAIALVYISSDASCSQSARQTWEWERRIDNVLPCAKKHKEKKK